VDAEGAGEVVDGHVHVLSEFEDSGCGVRDFGNRSKGYEDADLLLKVLLESRHSSAVEHLSGSLGMADISVLFNSSLSGHVVENGRDVVLSHLLPVEGPELLLVLVRIVSSVLATVGVATRVAKPHIITSSSSDKSRGNFRVVHSPAVSRIEDTMLQKNSGLSKFLGFSCKARDAPYSENVSVFSGDSVGFELESILNCQFLEVSLAVTSSVPSKRNSSN